MNSRVLRRRVPTGLLTAVVGVSVLVAALLPLRDELSLATVVMLFLVPVVAAAALGGLWPSLVAVVAADLAVNFFFVPTYHTFAVESSEHLILLVVYLLVAAAVSAGVDLAARQRATAAARALETQRVAARAADLAEIDRVRSALLAAVGHDLRTPLTGIKAAVATLRQPELRLSDDDRAELLAGIEESSDRLENLVENLLSMSRLQAGVLSVHARPVPLDAVVAEALLHLRTPAVVDVPDDLPPVRVDPGLLERVLANLIANAESASPDGRPIEVRGTARGDRVLLRIVDHGPGVPDGDRERMFAPFQRLHDRTTTDGIGLGLAIARGFTQAMDSTITPSETPGGGLTMTLDLPVAARVGEVVP